MDLIDFYLNIQKGEKLYSDEGYNLLKNNNIDPALYVDEEPDVEAGPITFGEVKEEEKTDLANDVVDFVKSMPKDMIVSFTKGITNGFDFVNNVTNFVGINPNSSYEFVKDKIDNQLKRLDELDKDSPLVSKMLAVAGQDAVYTVPIYKKLKAIGLPQQYRLPISFALGTSLAFNKSDSFLLDTETIKDFKEFINLPKETSAEELFDKGVQLIEYGGMGFAFDKLFPILKAIKRSNWQQNAVAVGGGTATGTIADKATADENFNKDEFINKADLSEEAIRATNKAAKKAGDYLRQQGIETNR